MKYNKANASVILFDNSDVITASGRSCGHQTSGNSCSNNGLQKFENCPSMNHAHGLETKDLLEEFGLL